MTEPHDCSFFEWHGPAPAEGAEWTPCIGCSTPLALPPEPMFWPEDVWKHLIENRPHEIVLSADEANEDGTYDTFAVPVSGGLFATLLARVSDMLKRSGYTMVSDWELTELKERAGVPPWWEPGRPLP